MACSVLTPLPVVTRLDTRLGAFPTASLPLDRPVSIRWDEHQIPFVETETDGDAAFALGLVHAHRRLGQMGVVRRIVQGRLSESAGPLTVDLDHAIRTLDVYRAADDILAAMPQETRIWMDRHVAGVNHAAAHQMAVAPPHEFSVLSIASEPWTAQDSIALGRASGIDLNWDFLLRILSVADPALRDRIATRLVRDDPGGAQAVAAFPGQAPVGARPVLESFAGLAALAARSGSNSMVAGPERSATGAELIASDPHLAFIFPNAWIVAGLRSPSYNLVGIMVPGTPVFAFGRNERVAWGGTNLRARTSQFVDVSGLDRAAITRTQHRIGVRLFPDARRETRQTPYGPILSDLDLLSDATGTFALRWTGHTVTDETRDGRDLPADLDPPRQFIASANDRPARDGERPFGGVFPQDERIRRLNELLASMPRATLDDLAGIQMDVVSRVALDLVATIDADLRGLSFERLMDRRARDALLDWEGAYHADAEAPAIFEAFLTALAPLTCAALGRTEEGEAFAALGRLPLYLIEDLPLLSPERRAQVLAEALRPAGRIAAEGTRWGDLHRFRVTHVLGNAPVIGRRYDIATLPRSGSRETILKTAHDLTAEPHLTMFGAQARHLADMGDIDETYVVLLGGQDGWINSTTFADQVAPFMKGGLIRVPLRPVSVAQAFRRQVTLFPKN